MNLSGLDALTSVGQELVIAGNLNLSGLTELAALNSIGGQLHIENNPALTSLAGLEGIAPNSITSLTITNSAMLSMCDMPNICTFLLEHGTATISGNAAGCANLVEVEEACTVCGDGYVSGMEGCDDNNTAPGDGCDAVCEVETAN